MFLTLTLSLRFPYGKKLLHCFLINAGPYKMSYFENFGCIVPSGVSPGQGGKPGDLGFTTMPNSPAMC